MKGKMQKSISVRLIFLVMVSIFVACAVIAVVGAKKNKVEVESKNINNFKSNYETEDYEIKDEETWDISEEQDESVIAKWTSDNKTLTISGSGNTMDWDPDEENDWHNTGYQSSIENVIIEEGITNIGGYAFSGCSSLIKINIPDSVISIGGSAFEDCSSLENINIPNSVTSIDWYAFSGCSSLVSITIPDSITSIEESTFENCSSLTSISIPNSVTNILDYAFEGCSSLENINIPNSVEVIEYQTFKDCTSLARIIIPNSITRIEEDAFLNCNSLKSINIPDSVTMIGDNIVPESTVIYTRANSEGHSYAENAGKKYVLDNEGPTATFTPEKGEDNQKSYNVTVEVNDNFDEVGVNESTLRYQWTQSIEEPTKESFTETFENGQSITKDSGDGEWYLWIYAEDNLQNEKITKSDAFNFDDTDKIPPVLETIYSTEELTNKNVTVTIKANEEIQEVEGWTISEDKMSLTKEYENNTTDNGEVIEVKDLAGNSATVTIKITNIDKEAPNPEVKYSTKDLTNKNVVVTITSNEQIQEVEGWAISEDKMSLTKEYENNTTDNGEVIEVKDLAGNGTTVTIKILNIQRKFETDQYKKVNDYIVKIKPNTTYNEFVKNIQTNQTYTVKEGSKIISGTNIIKTGQVLTTQTGRQYTLVVMGDLNGDGKIRIIELARISKIGSGKIKDYKEIEKMAIDANVDGKINILDMAAIAKLATEKK